MGVLLIEDDTLLCELLRDSLTQAGFEVDASHTGVYALRLYQKRRYQIIVLDLILPDIPGLAVLSTIRELREDPPPSVIIFSGRDDDAAHRRADELGVDDYLIKPFDTEHLTTRVRALANRAEHLAAVPQRRAAY